MNPKLIEAQCEAQALHESFRAALVEYQAQKLKADAQDEVSKASKRHCDELRREMKEANEKLMALHEAEQNMRVLAGGGRIAQ